MSRYNSSLLTVVGVDACELTPKRFEGAGLEKSFTGFGHFSRGKAGGGVWRREAVKVVDMGEYLDPTFRGVRTEDGESLCPKLRLELWEGGLRESMHAS